MSPNCLKPEQCILPEANHFGEVPFVPRFRAILAVIKHPGLAGTRIAYETVRGTPPRESTPNAIPMGMKGMPPPMSNVISLQVVRSQKYADAFMLDYQARILGLDKLGLLEEMIRFQEERSLMGESMPDEMMMRGKFLFKALEEKAETEELRLLSRSFRRHLEVELDQRRHS